MIRTVGSPGAGLGCSGLPCWLFFKSNCCNCSCRFRYCNCCIFCWISSTLIFCSIWSIFSASFSILPGLIEFINLTPPGAEVDRVKVVLGATGTGVVCATVATVLGMAVEDPWAALANFNLSIRLFFDPDTGSPLLFNSFLKSMTLISSSFIGLSACWLSAGLLFCTAGSSGKNVCG